MNVKFTVLLIAVTAALLIACSAELTPSTAPVTGTDGSTANATAPPTAENPPAVDPVAIATATPTLHTTITAAASATPTPPPQATSPTNTPSPQPADLQVNIATIPANLPQYDRDDWKHWIDADGDCQDARQEVLVAESRATPSFRTDSQCRVEAGQWLAPYSAIIVTDPGDLDVDHMVPLRNAHYSGAWAWTAERKRLYANYLADPQHLIAVTARANRSKGARGPEEWKPDDQTYWCQYAIDWITVKDNWDLTVTLRELDALTGMLDTCANPPRLQLSQGGTPIVPRPTNGPHYPTPTPTAITYSSCDAAQAAGEHRAQGSKGSGQGFPTSMVPSARDGDGDGVVCER